ncbi:MAG: glycosyltransferase family 2 protein [Gemmataceae bacterium]|nr:glycosyltransferase family 2 protein [Gemmataceae bacterium]
MPRISVVIPTYNGERWLGDCVRSVLAQTCSAAEIIVVVDGSTDGTAELLRELGPRVTTIAQQRGGIGAARNAGLQRATGEYVAFLDHDDLWKPDKLRKQVDMAVRDAALDVIYTDAEEFTDRGVVHASFFKRFHQLRTPGDMFRMLVHFHIPLMSTILMRREFLNQHGLSFFAPASGVDDLGLLLEIAAHGGRFACLDEALTRRRLHGGNLSKDHCNRFARRVALYEELLRHMTDHRQRRLLHWGLRHAHFCLGEHALGQRNRLQARAHLRRGIGADTVGVRAAAHFLASCLPPIAYGFLVRNKQRLLQKA